MSIETRQAVGFVGPQLKPPTESYPPEVKLQMEASVRALVREAIDGGQAIIVEATNALCIPVLKEAINHSDGIFHLKVLLPTNRTLYNDYLDRAARNGFMAEEEVGELKQLLSNVAARHKSALVEYPSLTVDEQAHRGVGAEFFRRINRVEFFAVGMQLEGNSGQAGTSVENHAYVIGAWNRGIDASITNIALRQRTA